MTLDWMDVSNVSFNVLLLLEREQLGWLAAAVDRRELATALKAHPVVEWYLREKNPDLAPLLDGILPLAEAGATPERVRAIERSILERCNDFVVYALDPARYDALPFLSWDDAELTGLVEFGGKTVIDVGSGTGRLALVAAREGAHAVFAVEPVANLRRYLAGKAREGGHRNLHPVDGLITSIPLPDRFADVTMGGHVFGDEPEAECDEMERVTKAGGRILLCPGGDDEDGERHRVLLERRFEWARFEEPGAGLKRKYWKTMP